MADPNPRFMERAREAYFAMHDAEPTNKGIEIIALPVGLVIAVGYGLGKVMGWWV